MQMKRRAKIPEDYRRLKVGEVIQAGDYTWTKNSKKVELHITTGADGMKVEKTDSNFYYRKI